MIRTEVTVAQPLGIHARVARELTLTAARFVSSGFISYAGRTASLQSPIAVMALGAGPGARVTVIADGADEAAAASAVVALLGPGEPAR